MSKQCLNCGRPISGEGKNIIFCNDCFNQVAAVLRRIQSAKTPAMTVFERNRGRFRDAGFSEGAERYIEKCCRRYDEKTAAAAASADAASADATPADATPADAASADATPADAAPAFPSPEKKTASHDPFASSRRGENASAPSAHTGDDNFYASMPDPFAALRTPGESKTGFTPKPTPQPQRRRAAYDQAADTEASKIIDINGLSAAEILAQVYGTQDTGDASPADTDDVLPAQTPAQDNTNAGVDLSDTYDAPQEDAVPGPGTDDADASAVPSRDNDGGEYPSWTDAFDDTESSGGVDDNPETIMFSPVRTAKTGSTSVTGNDGGYGYTDDYSKDDGEDGGDDDEDMAVYGGAGIIGRYGAAASGTGGGRNYGAGNEGGGRGNGNGNNNNGGGSDNGNDGGGTSEGNRLILICVAAAAAVILFVVLFWGGFLGGFGAGSSTDDGKKPHTTEAPGSGTDSDSGTETGTESGTDETDIPGTDEPGTSHVHQWVEATCTEPRTCVVGGETEGAPLGHDYGDASCDMPATCSRCGLSTGVASGHTWSEPTFTWSSDNKSVAAVFTCTRNAAHKDTVTVTSAAGGVPATCTAEGHTVYTATVTHEGATYTDERDGGTTPAKGHSWGAPKFTWASDGSSCTATFTCTNDSAHKESVAASVSAGVVSEATCTETGSEEYKATVTFNGKTYSDSRSVELPATGHSFADGEISCSHCGEPRAAMCSRGVEYRDRNSNLSVMVTSISITSDGCSVTYVLENKSDAESEDPGSVLIYLASGRLISASEITEEDGKSGFIDPGETRTFTATFHVAPDETALLLEYHSHPDDYNGYGSSSQIFASNPDAALYWKLN